MDRSIAILIADDHPVVRSGLRTIIGCNPSLQVLYEAGDGDTALQLIRQKKPDLAILDVEMPLMDGFGVAKAIQEEAIPVDVIFMTLHKDEQTFNKAMDVGMKGYLLKENAVTEILDAIVAIAEGKYYLSPALSEHLMRRRTAPVRAPGTGELTPAERRVLSLIAEQKTTKTIAGELFISPKTVERHRSNISAKLGLRGAFSLLRYAMENRGGSERPF
jgi:DNA-binding NarL/FixJ family response regulator